MWGHGYDGNGYSLQGLTTTFMVSANVLSSRLRAGYWRNSSPQFKSLYRGYSEYKMRMVSTAFSALNGRTLS